MDKPTIKGKGYGKYLGYGALGIAGLAGASKAIGFAGDLISNPNETVKETAAKWEFTQAASPYTSAAVVGAAAIGTYAFKNRKSAQIAKLEKAGDTAGAKKLKDHFALERKEKWKERGESVKSKFNKSATLGRFHLKFTDSVVNTIAQKTGKRWDNVGIMNTLGTAGKMGALYGGLTTVASMGLNRSVSEEAMASSQQGGVYEGNDQFSSRRTSVMTMGQSTQNLVQGLHNRR